MRIGVGGLHHETNSFSNVYVTLEELQALRVEGEAVYRANAGVASYIGGFLAEGEAQGIEMVLSAAVDPCPSGHITQAALENHRDRIVELLWQAHREKPLDAIALNLHGAGVADGYPDADGEIIRAVREKFGPDMPIGTVLDLHASVTDGMMEYADILIGIKCYPHTDKDVCGRYLIRFLVDMVRTGKRPFMRKIRLPWLMVPAQGVTTSGPAQQMQQFLFDCEKKDPQLLHASFFHGFPYSDIGETGVTVTTLAKTQESADRNALQIARHAWEHRADFAVPAYSAREAMDMAQKLDVDGPVVINESSDNTGGGAPGDGTHLLREMLKRNLPGTAVGYIYDPEVVQQAVEAGVGATICCRLGGKLDKLHGEPVELKNAYVKTVSDGRYINQSPVGKGSQSTIGLCVCLEVGNVSIVVGSVRKQPMDDGPLRVAGLRYDLLKYILVKSSQHFKGWWAPRAGGIVTCDSPGIHCADLKQFDFKFTNTNYYPLQDVQWEPRI